MRSPGFTAQFSLYDNAGSYSAEATHALTRRQDVTPAKPVDLCPEGTDLVCIPHCVFGGKYGVTCWCEWVCRPYPHPRYVRFLN